MKELNPTLVKTIEEALKGKRLETFQNCVAIINESLALGGWTLRGSIKSVKGFSQGLVSHLGYNRENFGDYTKDGRVETEESIKQDNASKLARCLEGSSGTSSLHWGIRLESVESAFNTLNGSFTRQGKEIKIKHSLEVIKAWIELCDEVKEARMRLDKYRTLPVITEIGVSPRVTRTLEEMNMSAVGYKVKLAELERHEEWIKVKNSKTGELVDFLNIWYTVKWTKGIQHRKSRFGMLSCNCEACGKRIPSGRFVAMEMHKDNGETFSMWVGTDCASNLFGIKDVGVERPQESAK